MNKISRMHATRQTIAACMAFVLSSNAATAQNQSAEVLNNSSVIQMIGAKVSKDIILSKLKSTSNTFDVSPKGLFDLQTNKVPYDVIKAMLAVPSTTPSEKLTNEGVIYMVSNQVWNSVILEKIRLSRPDFDLTASGLVALQQNKVPSSTVKAMMAATAPAPVPTTASAAATVSTGSSQVESTAAARPVTSQVAAATTPASATQISTAAAPVTAPAASASQVPKGKLGRVFIKAGTSEGQFADPMLDDTAKDMKRRARDFVVVENENEADFLLLVVERHDEVRGKKFGGGNGSYKVVNATVSVRDGDHWKPGAKIMNEGPNNGASWGLAAGDIMERTAKWIRANR